MKLLIDGRVLKHKKITGVERYVLELLTALDQGGVRYDLAVPSSGNRYGQHLWEHTALAFRARKYDLLFSPGNIAPLWKPARNEIRDHHPRSCLSGISRIPIRHCSAFTILWSIPRLIKISDAVLTLSERRTGKND